MLVFAAICPHSPMLIPAIGKDNTPLFAKTLEAYKGLKARLDESEAEVLVILTPHGEAAEDKFVIPAGLANENAAAQYQINFKEFGDLATKFEVPAQTVLANHWRENLKKDFKFKITQTETLDYGAGVPLFYLNKERPLPTVVIGQADLDRVAHWHLGEMLGEEFLASETRVAVIASGELSHCLNENAPGGYVPSAKTFDNRLIELLNQKENESGKPAGVDILALDEKEIVAIKECGLKTITTLLGILSSSRYEPEFLAYESPLGVGCLTMNFKLNH